MKDYLFFGQKLRELRSLKKQSITQVSSSLGVDRTHLSKLENGHERPSFEVLNSIVKYYSLSEIDAAQLSKLAGYDGRGLIVGKSIRKEEPKMEEKQIPDSNTPKTVQINMPNNTLVLYTDSVFVTATQFGIVFDFAQSMGPTDQQTVVSRVGMSKEHGKALLKVLKEKLEDAEIMGSKKVRV